eukprot:scaffold367621_cov14-Prasinocladus_malaysianus.AAC.1
MHASNPPMDPKADLPSSAKETPRDDPQAQAHVVLDRGMPYGLAASAVVIALLASCLRSKPAAAIDKMIRPHFWGAGSHVRLSGCCSLSLK